MIRFFFVRLVLPILVLLLVRALLKSVFAGFRSAMQSSSPPANRPSPSVPAGGELKKDPVCGTYVSAATSLTRTINGNVLYFCSAECRDRYRAA